MKKQINNSLGVPVGDTSGVTDHGALTGLSDDDHSQYVLVAGTRAFTGDQSMGSHKLTSVTDPASAQDASTKNYCDGKILKSTLTAKGNVLIASASATPAVLAVGSDYLPLISLASATNGVTYGIPQGSDISRFVGSGTFDLRFGGAVQQAVSTTLAVSVDTIYAYPFFVPSTITITKLAFEVTTVAGAGGKARCAIYDSTSTTTPTPNSIIATGSEFDVTAGGGTGSKETTLSAQLVGPGVFWMAFICGTAAPTVRAMALGQTHPLLGWTTALGVQANVGITKSAAYGAMPASFGGSLSLRAALMPAVFHNISSAP